MTDNRNAWLTIDSPGTPMCRALVIPANFLPHVMGALGALTEEFNWEEQGAMTAAECAAEMATMWEAIRKGCSMIGALQAFAVDTLPEEYLECDGAQYNRVDYPELYAVLSPALILDADTFLVPSLQDRVIVGSGGEWVDGDTGGSETHTLTANEIPSHDHTIQHAYGNDVVNGYLGAIAALVPTQSEETTSTAGGGFSHNNMQPYSVWKWAIRAKP